MTNKELSADKGMSPSKAADEILTAINNVYYIASNKHLPDFVEEQTRYGTIAVIHQAITQATSELQAENERLKDKIKLLEKLREDSDAACRDWSQAAETLKAQVAGLVEVFGALLGPVPSPELFPRWFMEVLTERHENAQNAIKNTQATADAYTAKIIDGFVARILHGDSDHRDWLKSEAEKYLQSPIPSSEKEGDTNATT